MYISEDIIYAQNLSYYNRETSELYKSSDLNYFEKIFSFDKIDGRYYVNPFDINEIFFVSDQVKGEVGIWYSNNSGKTWDKVFDKPVEMLTFSESNNLYYALSLDYQDNSTTLYKCNNAFDWNEISIIENIVLVNYFTINPNNEKQIILAVRGGLIYSGDEGDTWKYYNEDDEIVDAIFTGLDDEFYFTTSLGKIYMKNETDIVELKISVEFSEYRAIPQTLTLRKGTNEIYLMLTSGIQNSIVRIVDGKLDGDFKYTADYSFYNIMFNVDNSNELYVFEPNGAKKIILTE
jgi:hypothetical protein